jgi:hypothetical protein
MWPSRLHIIPNLSRIFKCGFHSTKYNVDMWMQWYTLHAIINYSLQLYVLPCIIKEQIDMWELGDLTFTTLNSISTTNPLDTSLKWMEQPIMINATRRKSVFCNCNLQLIFIASYTHVIKKCHSFLRQVACEF